MGMEAELARERDLLRPLLDHLPDAIYFKDRGSRFVRVSQFKLQSALAAARVRYQQAHPGNGADSLPEHLSSLERFAEYLPGKSDFDFFDEARARAAYEDEQEIMRTGEPIIGKTERTTWPDGRVTWCLTTKMPWLDQEGIVIGTFGMSKDITPLKEAEQKCEAAHRELMAASRQAGMAEVATSVLHNVGNVLNSVKVSSGLVSDLAKRSKIPSLARVAQLMHDHEADLGSFISTDSKGRQLPGYLTQLAEHLTAEQAQLQKELAVLKQNIEHIEEIVSMQQSYAKTIGLSETVKPEDLVEDALRMNAGALARHDVHLVREYDPQVPLLTIEKHKVLQVLVNLVRNAKYACDDSGRLEKRMTVRVTSRPGWVQIIVQDNGVGIPPENLPRLFTYGFTTRKNGHGFGLHSGALAARELGGALLAHSAGPGLGATFTLELPLPKNQ